MDPVSGIPAENAAKGLSGLLATLGAALGPSAFNKAFAGILSQLHAAQPQDGTPPPVAGFAFRRQAVAQGNAAPPPPPRAWKGRAQADTSANAGPPPQSAQKSADDNDNDQAQATPQTNPATNTAINSASSAAPPPVPGCQNGNGAADNGGDASASASATAGTAAPDASAPQTPPASQAAGDTGPALPDFWAQAAATWLRNLAPANASVAASAEGAPSSPAVTAADPQSATASAGPVPTAGDSFAKLQDLLQAFLAQPGFVPAGEDDSQNNSTSAATDANGNSTVDPLTQLLQQLAQLAAAQANIAPPPAAQDGTSAPPSAANATDQAAGAAVPAIDPQILADLRKLLVDFARHTASLQATGNAPDGTPPAPQDGSQTADTALSSAAGATPKADGALPSKTDWSTYDFFSLFTSAPPPAPPSNLNSSFAPVFAAALPSANGGDTTDTADGGQQQGGNLARGADLPAASTSGMPNAAATRASSPYDFASQLSALRFTSGGAAGLPAAVEQVVLQMSRTLRNGSSEMSIQLRPAELGRIDVKLNFGSDGKVQGTVMADNSTTLHLLLKDVGSLERALQEAGLRADSGCLQFSLRGDGQAGGQAGNAFAQANGQGSDSATLSSATDLALPDEGSEIYYVTPGRVNLRV